MSNARHIPQLDGLRGVAILLVLSLHTLGGAPAYSALANAMNIGWIGVDLFFVLSGFLITRVLLASKGHKRFFRNFYARRALRIWPIYYLVLLFAFLVVPHLDPQLRFDPARSWWGYYALFVQNLAVPDRFGPWPVQVTWSLAIEEQFYLVWPVLVWACGLRSLKVLLTTVIVAVPFLRLLALLSGVVPVTVYIVTPFRIDALACGALVAVLLGEEVRSGSRTRPLYRWTLWVLPVALVATAFGLDGDRLITASNPVSSFDAVMLATTLTLLALGFAGLLLYVIERPSTSMARAMGSQPLRYIGMVSFGLYLYHGLLIPLFNFYVRPSLSASLSGHPISARLASLIALYLMLFTVAHLSWRLVEQPILRLKRHFA